MLLPQQPLDNATEIFRLVVESCWQHSIEICIVARLLSFDDGRDVLILIAILTKMEVFGSVEGCATVDSLVRDEVGETAEDVATYFALVD